jgi:Domain of Unknown Function (DUF1080)
MKCLTIKSLSRGCVLGILLTCVSISPARETVTTPDLSQIDRPQSWHLINAESNSAMEAARRVIRLRPKGEVTPASNIGLALVEGLEFGVGTLDIDLKGKGKSERSFVGVAFSAADGKNFEAVYFRPFNFQREDPYRARAVQYVAWPDHTWEKLREGQPGKYESAIKPIPDPSGWFHARIEVTKHKVRVWVNDSKQPCLVVDRLASREKGKVGLWVDSHEGWFSNLKVRAAK